jgi:hypothetical protein
MTDLAQEDMDRTQREREAAIDELLEAEQKRGVGEDAGEREEALPEK